MNEKFMQIAIALSQQSIVSQKGGPFGAVITKDNQFIAGGRNQVTIINDPTAHAEIQTIRQACQELTTFDLTGCSIYSSCEPCPMCLSAIYWAGITTIYYAASKNDAANINFSDAFIYSEINKSPEQRQVRMRQLMRAEAVTVFAEWQKLANKIMY